MLYFSCERLARAVRVGFSSLEFRSHQIDSLAFGFTRSFEKKIQIKVKINYTLAPSTKFAKNKNKRVLPHHQQTTDKIFFFIYLVFHFVRIACNSNITINIKMTKQTHCHTVPEKLT